MLRLLMTRWYLMMLTLFAPVLAFAQGRTPAPTSAPRDANPGTWGIVLVGLIFVGGLFLIYFRRYSKDWRSRGQG